MTNSLALDHLLLRLRPIHRALRAAVETREPSSATEAELEPLCVTPGQAAALLQQVETVAAARAGAPAVVTHEEAAAETELRALAAARDFELPLDRLARDPGLSAFEQEVLLLCAAPELDPAYERLYAFILDDLNRRYPCIELLAALTAQSFTERIARRRALGRFGLLQRAGILQPHGDPGTELRREFRLGPGVFHFLTSGEGDPAIRLRDPQALNGAEDAALPPNVPEADAAALAAAFANGRASIAMVFGPRHAGHEELVHWMAARLQRPLRFIPDLAAPRTAAEAQTLVRDALETAAVLGALLWLPLEAGAEAVPEAVENGLAAALAGTSVPVVITGLHPLRHSRLVQSGYIEMELVPPDFEQRRRMWRNIFPDLDADQAADFAARYRLGSADIRAVRELAVAGGQRDPEAVCAIVTRRRCENFATLVKPKRGKDDLVLPPELHRQVLEVASFFRLWPRVGDQWGFARLQTGTGGVKALFTGEPGTGKTLAAEVIAGELKLQLLKVDLARVVSKWVGETEKNLDSVFREAEESHSVLFFDEADALFGKRGEVQRGADRYANLEVSYLLQRLEDHYGLVILASNQKDQIDAAFIRRFPIVLEFRRPAEPERRRIWKIAFPETAPLDERVDLETLSRLDLTGAAITAISRNAALLSAAENAPAIEMSHVVAAAARQFRREARVLTASHLGKHAALLQGAV